MCKYNIYIYNVCLHMCVYTYIMILHCMGRMNWRKISNRKKRSEVTVIQVRYNGGLNEGCGSKDKKI